MTQKAIGIFLNEFFSKRPKKIYSTNKTDVYHIDDIWSSDILDPKDYGCENKRGYRYVLVIIDRFSKFAWTVPLEKKNGQTKKDSFEKFLINSKRKPQLIETDRVKAFYNIIFQKFLKKNNIKLIKVTLRKSSFGTIFAARLNRTIRNLLKRPVLIWMRVKGLIYYLQKRNNIIVEFFHLPKESQFKLR